MIAARCCLVVPLLLAVALAEGDGKGAKEGDSPGNFMEDEQWLSSISQYSGKIKHWNRFRDIGTRKQLLPVVHTSKGDAVALKSGKSNSEFMEDFGLIQLTAHFCQHHTFVIIILSVSIFFVNFLIPQSWLPSSFLTILAVFV